MNKLMGFEWIRNKRKLLLFFGCLLSANVVLTLLDPDMEKVTISGSILILILPFIYICMDFARMLRMDLVGDTRYLYLSAARTKHEIMGAKLLTTAAYTVVYTGIVSLFQGANALGGWTFMISLGFSVTALLMHAAAGYALYRKKIYC